MSPKLQLHSIPGPSLLQYHPHPQTPLCTLAFTPSISPSAPNSSVYLGLHSPNIVSTPNYTLYLGHYSFNPPPSAHNTSVSLSLHSLIIPLTHQLHNVTWSPLPQYPPHPPTTLCTWAFTPSTSPSPTNCTVYLVPRSFKTPLITQLQCVPGHSLPYYPRHPPTALCPLAFTPSISHLIPQIHALPRPSLLQYPPHPPTPMCAWPSPLQYPRHPQLQCVAGPSVTQYLPHPPTPLCTWAFTPSISPLTPICTVHLDIHFLRTSTPLTHSLCKTLTCLLFV